MASSENEKMNKENYYRKITALLPRVKKSIDKIKLGFNKKMVKKNLLIFFLFFLFLTSIFLAYCSFEIYQLYNRVDADYKKGINSLSYWEAVVEKHPNYTDAYYKLALEAFKIKKFDKAAEYLDKALFLDPNFEKAKDLKALIVN
ncbi:MAG: hypothetical protein COU27_02560 [Candidatus Levybacteria bacterium CG10_big_fil_rev_8_21_14_0_10_36_7]|nr:MAG: hypothetical protein COU27_02560 [Candidatus Levybacteria bacterium CG10_big_fil_rev_8_21_14_0_10_36_7]